MQCILTATHVPADLLHLEVALAPCAPGITDPVTNYMSQHSDMFPLGPTGTSSMA